MSCILIVIIGTITILILTNPSLSLQYALQGLSLWYDKMIPTLFPFMILSEMMIKLQLTEKIASFFSPLLRPLYRVSKNVIYCMSLGFLCGFPMGAKVTAELYRRKELSKKEADFLLVFTNNIGPIYFCGYVLPLLKRKLFLPYIFGMYGIPLLYGLVMRYTLFRDIPQSSEGNNTAISEKQIMGTENKRFFSVADVFTVLNQAICSSGYSILMLGGYMILFNLSLILPHIFLGNKSAVVAPLLEISGGIAMLGSCAPLYSFLVLSFGGLSCIAQTSFCMEGTDLSIHHYILHKVFLTVITAVYYFIWYLFSSTTFLM